MLKKYLKAGLLASSVIIAIAAALLCPPCDCGIFYGVQPLISPAIRAPLTPYLIYLAGLVLAGVVLALSRIDVEKYWKVGAVVTLAAYVLMFIKLVRPELTIGTMTRSAALFQPSDVNTLLITALFFLALMAINMVLSAVSFAVAEKLKR